MPDFFEIERLVEDLAKIYSTACATTWFKLEKVKHPSREEFRSKVVEFMKHFNYTLSVYPAGQESVMFRIAFSLISEYFYSLLNDFTYCLYHYQHLRQTLEELVAILVHAMRYLR